MWLLVTFVYVSGRRCLDFARTLKWRQSARQELLTDPELLSDWAVQVGMLDAGIGVSDDDFAAAIALRNGTARREGTAAQLLASLAADLLDLLAGNDIEKGQRLRRSAMQPPVCGLVAREESAPVRHGDLRH